MSIKQNHQLKNERGIGLVEVMILLVVLSLLGVGSSTLLKSLLETQRKSDVKDNLNNARNNLIQTLQNDNAWANTVNSYGFASPERIGCLRDNVPLANQCVNGSAGTAFNVLNQDGSIFYEGQTLTTGITPEGGFCNAFDNVNGSNDCPYRFELTTTLTCGSSEATCRKPRVTITGTLLIRPQDRGGPLGRLDPAEFNFTINRGERNRYEPFRILYVSTSNASPDIEGGACTPGTWVTRKLNTYPAAEDVGRSVLTFDAALSRFQLREGEYECTVTAQAFGQEQGFSIELAQQDPSANPLRLPVGAGYTPPFATGQVSGTVRVSISSPMWFHVQHYCVASTSVFDMGIAHPNYAEGYTFTQVSCVRFS